MSLTFFIFAFKSILLIFLSKYQFTFSLSIAEKFPFTLIMSNGDIFVVTADGIRVFDSTLQTRKFYHDFNCTLITTVDGAAKTSITQFPNDYILALYNNILFVCSSEGDYIFEIDLNTNINGLYYSLIPHKKDSSDIFYYIITFYDNGRLTIQYYQLIISSRENTRLANYQYTPHN